MRGMSLHNWPVRACGRVCVVSAERTHVGARLCNAALCVLLLFARSLLISVRGGAKSLPFRLVP